jgi:hypothetical protein
VRLQDGIFNVPTEGPNSIEMWFKTPAGHAASGVLYSYQYAPVDGGAPATTAWTPALYIGADGYLRGSLWTGSVTPITSTTKVNDGNWHHVVLSASYTELKQTLYLDNAIAGTKSGQALGTTAELSYIGAGTTRSWPGRVR